MDKLIQVLKGGSGSGNFGHGGRPGKRGGSGVGGKKGKRTATTTAGKERFPGTGDIHDGSKNSVTNMITDAVDGEIRKSPATGKLEYAVIAPYNKKTANVIGDLGFVQPPGRDNLSGQWSNRVFAIESDQPSRTLRTWESNPGEMTIQVS